MANEKAIKTQILTYLNRLPNCLAFEIYNSAVFHSKLQRHVRNATFRPKGVPDILGVYSGKPFGIEVKTETGRLSEEQKMLHEKMNRHAWRVCVCRSVKDAQRWIAHMNRSLETLAWGEGNKPEGT